MDRFEYQIYPARTTSVWCMGRWSSSLVGEISYSLVVYHGLAFESTYNKTWIFHVIRYHPLLAWHSQPMGPMGTGFPARWKRQKIAIPSLGTIDELDRLAEKFIKERSRNQPRDSMFKRKHGHVIGNFQNWFNKWPSIDWLKYTLF